MDNVQKLNNFINTPPSQTFRPSVFLFLYFHENYLNLKYRQSLLRKACFFLNKAKLHAYFSSTSGSTLILLSTISFKESLLSFK
jgi:hypothetical protein